MSEKLLSTTTTTMSPPSSLSLSTIHNFLLYVYHCRSSFLISPSFLLLPHNCRTESTQMWKFILWTKQIAEPNVFNTHARRHHTHTNSSRLMEFHFVVWCEWCAAAQPKPNENCYLGGKCLCLRTMKPSRNLCQCKSNQIKREVERAERINPTARCDEWTKKICVFLFPSPSSLITKTTATTSTTRWLWWIYTRKANSLLVITIQKRSEPKSKFEYRYFSPG